MTSVRSLRAVWRGSLAAVLRGNLMSSALGLVAGLVLAQRYLNPTGRGLLAIALAWSGIAIWPFSASGSGTHRPTSLRGIPTGTVRSSARALHLSVISTAL